MGEESAIVIPSFIDKVISFDDGVSYELLRPLTTYRQCHDGTPPESRMVFICKQIDPDDNSSEEYIMKIKIRVPHRGQEDNTIEGAEVESSNTTRAEVRALTKFLEADTSFAPQLVNYKKAVQGPDGPLPDGYVTFTVMTKMPGDSLHNLYFWGMPEEERQKITQAFLVALRSVYALGIEPVDCALRNVLWERETGRCTIIDFEIWRETDGSIDNEIKELQRWGLARRPAAKNHWEAWNEQWR
ncbi:uncharacterized protein PV06_09643 [Exophiala oligosperma]|uniref:Protein kinase domain-containing protein n=1 Tax=Exophiala oligosperma TaxID=215243 RepID=A0A0D2D673_9EURO|nr:uncharacterized protein PV06_09643 [Exophiala oligosperma]KIW38693.1 hypothetical protein PV06_09643 [Exophiala oligosperma]